MKRQAITWIIIIAASLALGIFIEERVNVNSNKWQLDRSAALN